VAGEPPAARATSLILTAIGALSFVPAREKFWKSFSETEHETGCFRKEKSAGHRKFSGLSKNFVDTKT
jgi:hypothetical protein